MDDLTMPNEQPPARMVAGAPAHLSKHMESNCPRAAYLAAMLVKQVDSDPEADPHLREHARETAPKRVPGHEFCGPIKRTKLWDLKDKYHCPVIGTCLPMNELVKFARRFAFDVSLRDEFSMHVEAVNRVGTRNELSEALQKHLDRKYQVCLSRFDRAKTDADVLALWQEHCARGEVADVMWATLTHKAVSNETQHVVYTDVHMLSHQMGASQAADARRLAHLEKENAEATAAMKRQHRQQTRAEAELRQQLHKAVAELESLRQSRDGMAALQARIAAFESGMAMMDMGRRLMSLTAANEQMRVAAERGRALEKALKAAHGEAMTLARERDELAVERDALERLLLAGDADEEPCDGQCSSCDNATPGRCVLCVGGRTALVSQYRILAERLGIRLIHHDGGQEEALSRLPDMINSADAVICPTDCVSHNAYYQLKRHCKRTGKSCLLFKGAGISGFAVALARLSSGRVSLSADPIESSRAMAEK